MGKSKISIIIPVYNSDQFLEKCVDSVINQTYKNLEIILINDGSTDDSLSICAKYSKLDNRIIVVNQENKGVSEARNSGICVSTGDYIGFVDSDDYISHDMYEKLLVSALKHNSDITECGYFRVDTSDNIIDKSDFYDLILTGNYECMYYYLTKNNTTDFNVNKLYKRKIFSLIKYDSLKYSEDYLVNVKAHYYCEKKTVIKDRCYFYVNHNDSAVNQDFNETKFDIIKSAEMAIEFNNMKFPDLNKHIYLYILNNIKSLYMQSKKKIKLENKKYINKLLIEYNKYYNKLKQENFSAITSKKNLMSIKIFRYCPNVYYFLKRTYLFIGFRG